jgi:hypothetical protein
MPQNDSICHENASRVHQTSTVEHFYQKKYIPIFFKSMKKTADPPLLTQKLWRTLLYVIDSHDYHCCSGPETTLAVL